MTAVAIAPGPPLSAGLPKQVFSFRYVRDQTTGRTHDISPDGTRFVMVANRGAAQGDDTPAQQLILVENWLEELKRLGPVD